MNAKTARENPRPGKDPVRTRKKIKLSDKYLKPPIPPSMIKATATFRNSNLKKLSSKNKKEVIDHFLIILAAPTKSMTKYTNKDILHHLLSPSC